MEHIGKHELRIPMLRVFVKQLIKNLTSFRTVALEEVLAILPQALRALAPRPQRRIEREMAKQIEGVGIRLLRLFRKFLKAHAALSERLNDPIALIRVGSLLTQVLR